MARSLAFLALVWASSAAAVVDNPGIGRLGNIDLSDPVGDQEPTPGHWDGTSNNAVASGPTSFRGSDHSAVVAKFRFASASKAAAVSHDASRLVRDPHLAKAERPGVRLAVFGTAGAVLLAIVVFLMSRPQLVAKPARAREDQAIRSEMMRTGTATFVPSSTEISPRYRVHPTFGLGEYADPDLSDSAPIAAA
ncbi:hypothetical protein [Sandarakinorhabdus sp. DWP1-3-1]|uniref:hypothetical protein n=1 Tax=Sandarakinorhabdus sp. DWP1-3-1 TaxID=2804627 RepID=UPI003CEA1F08